MTRAEAARLKTLIRRYALAAARSGGVPTIELQKLNEYIKSLTHESPPPPAPGTCPVRRW